MRPMTYPEIYGLFGEDPPPGPTHQAVRTFFVDSLDREGGEAVVDHLHASTAPMAVAQLRVLGGAMGRVPVEATAFAHRRRRVLATLAALYERAEDEPEHEVWTTAFQEALPDRAPGAYVNVLSDEGDARVREAYPGPTWDRLAAVKRRYDPTNLFRLNQNIAVA
jgi:FAD/FMN-containing dehydrogenase